MSFVTQLEGDAEKQVLQRFQASIELCANEIYCCVVQLRNMVASHVGVDLQKMYNSERSDFVVESPFFSRSPHRTLATLTPPPAAGSTLAVRHLTFAAAFVADRNSCQLKQSIDWRANRLADRS
jgi:hypothetical protein